jgi:hypothetical protein
LTPKADGSDVSFQTYLDNRTPFTAGKFVLPDKEGQEVVLVVVSATFAHDGSRGGLTLAQKQSALELADLHYGPPHIASVRRESDIALHKPAVDVLINGSAHAPHGRFASSVAVSIAVGDVRKELLVSGDRTWRKGSFGSAATSPEPFATMPIVYERAFGGVDTRSEDPCEHAAEPRNLSGLGFRGVPSYDPGIHTELPNVEYPEDRQSTRTDMPRPAGLGVVSRGWQPRLAWAGTYDNAWLTRQWPLAPMDFDARHYQAAPPDQQSTGLRGGEPVTLRNLTPEGLWQFRLPTLDVPTRLIFNDRMEELPLRLDTVLIETDVRQVTMICRAYIRTRRNGSALQEIVLGQMTPAWVRARRTGKRFVDLSGHDGAWRSHRDFLL